MIDVCEWEKRFMPVRGRGREEPSVAGETSPDLSASLAELPVPDGDNVWPIRCVRPSRMCGAAPSPPRGSPAAAAVATTPAAAPPGAQMGAGA